MNKELPLRIWYLASSPLLQTSAPQHHVFCPMSLSLVFIVYKKDDFQVTTICALVRRMANYHFRDTRKYSQEVVIDGRVV